MPPVIIPGCVQVRLIYGEQGLLQYNVLSGLVASGFAVTQAIVNAVGSALASSFTTSTMAAHFATTASFNGVGIRDVRTPNQPELISTAAPVPGTGATDALPRQIALVVTLRTALAGRSFRGRVFVPGFIEGDNDANGLATTAAQTAATGWISAVQTALGAQGITLGVGSRRRYNQDGSTAREGFGTAVSAIVMRNAVWDTQRRRIR